FLPVFRPDAVIMGDGELDRVDPREIGRIEGMLAPGAALGRLAAHGGERVEHRIEHRYRMNAASPALLFERTANLRIDDRVEDDARAPLDILEDAFEMAFGADHRPQVANRADIVELREPGGPDHVERLAGRIREQVQVELARLGHEGAPRLWKSMGKSLAEPCGREQGQDSSLAMPGFVHSTANKGQGRAAACESRGSRARLAGKRRRACPSSCWQIRRETINPALRHPTICFHPLNPKESK